MFGNGDKIEEAVGKLARLTESESRLVSAETLSETKKTGRTLDEVSVTVNATNLTVQKTEVAVSQVDLRLAEVNGNFVKMMGAMNVSKAETEDEKEKKHRDKIKTILQPSFTAQDWYDKINKTRVPGTGDWVRGEDLFKSWFVKNNPVLWVSGTPGAGKSYLSSNVISFLREQYPQGIQNPSHVSIGYFFFKDDQPKTRSFHQALRDLAYQIAQNDPVYAKYITTQCDSPEDINTLHRAWRNLFVNFFFEGTSGGSSVYMVMDGVDEAYGTERQIFLELVKDLLRGK